MYIFELIAERKIREAMERGEFDNNPLQGKPLPKDHLENVPPDLRMAYKIDQKYSAKVIKRFKV